MKRFSISDIENLTGIKAHTIRVWEQRYNFFTPKRTETNIRYYDDADLCMFLNIATLNENGYKISKISKMETEEIFELVKTLKEDHQNTNIQVQMLTNAMLKMDEYEFDELITGCIDDMGMENAIGEIIFPFLKKVGFMWQVGTINPAHEHFATHKIEQKIIEATYKDVVKATPFSPRCVLFLPPNEHHEVGLLFAQYLLKKRGYQTLYLGQNLPYESLKEVVSYYEPDFAFTVLTVANLSDSVEQIIHHIKQEIGDTTLIAAGYQITATDLPKRESIIYIKNLSDFQEVVENLSNTNMFSAIKN